MKALASVGFLGTALLLPVAYAGKQIHEIHPVKFGGSPTDLANKIALTPAEHARLTTFWNRLMRDIK